MFLLLSTHSIHHVIQMVGRKKILFRCPNFGTSTLQQLDLLKFHETKTIFFPISPNIDNLYIHMIDLKKNDDVMMMMI